MQPDHSNFLFKSVPEGLHALYVPVYMRGSPLKTQSILPHSGDNFGSILETISPTIKSHFTNGATFTGQIFINSICHRL